MEPQLRMPGRAALAEHRHRRQPRADAEPAGRPGERRRHRGAEVARSQARVRAADGGIVLDGAGRHRAALRDAWSTPPACARRRWRGASRACPRRGAASVLRQGQLLHPGRARAVQPADLPGARSRRPRRAPDARPRRPGQVRPRRAVGRLARRPGGRPGARRCLLCRGAQVLARRCPTARCMPGYAGIRPKISGPGRAGARFRDPGAGDARRARAGQPVRHRVAGPDQQPGDRAPRGALARR